jgi:hypothetical protein
MTVTTTDEGTRDAARRKFSEMLAAKHEEACSPSQHEMEMRRMELAKDRGVSAATFSRTLRGLTFPRWDSTTEMLIGMGVTPETINSVWKPRWIRANAGQLPLDPPAAAPVAGGEPTTTVDHAVSECSECGALVVNPDRHRAWHSTFEAQTRRVVLRLVKDTAN